MKQKLEELQFWYLEHW